MKRLMSVILVLSLMLMLTSCLEIKKKRDRKEMLHIEEKVDMGERTVDISDGIENNGQSFSYSCDLDYDGIDDEISIEIIPSGEYEEVIKIVAGKNEIQFESFFASIKKVYSCDITEGDKTRDIAIITCEESGDPRLRILSYKNELQPYTFPDKYESDGEADCNWLGYACSYYFKVNDDDTLTIEEQTDSVGMWSVNKRYEFKDGVFKEIPYDKYVILPDFMSDREFFGENVTDEEKEKWKSGYIKAYIPFSNESISINEGEYIKPLYDNNKDRIYIEKESGETGYIDVGYDSSFERYAFNDMFFYLAG